MFKLNYPLFDGEKVWEGAAVTVESGIVKAAHKRELKVAAHATEIATGQPATMLLLDGRPDRRITDSSKIRNIWVKGEVFR